MQDLLVVGGGVVGLFCAAEAAQRGRSVTVITGPVSRPTASWAGGGILSPLFPWRYPDALAALTVHALKRYGDWQRRFSAAGVAEAEINACGMWVQTGDIARAEQWAQRHGVALVQERDGVFLPEVAAIRNPHLLKALEAYLRASGVRLVQDAVQTISTGDATARTLKDRFSARHLVLAAGAWSRSLLPPAERAGLPELFPAKGQMLLYPPTPRPLPRILLTDNGYLIPRKDGLVLAGSTLEPGIEDMRPDTAAAERLSSMAEALWPALAGVTPIAHWAGLRPGTSSPLPLITPVDAGGRTWLASGHYRNGLVAAPATAALLLDQLDGTVPFCDPLPFQSSASSLLSSSESF